MTEKQVRIPTYFEGINKSLKAKIDSLQAYLQDPAAGFAAEEYFRQVLRDHLPERYAVESGFVVSAARQQKNTFWNMGPPIKQRSHFMDIIIADVLHVPRLCKEPTYSVFPIEAVCAVVEVTTSPDNTDRFEGKPMSKFQADLLKIAQVRTMGRRRHYIRSAVIENPADGTARSHEQRLAPIALLPLSFLITSGNEWAKAETYRKNLIKGVNRARRTNKDAWVHGAFSASHGFLAFTKEGKAEAWNKATGLLEFLLFLNRVVARYSAPHLALDTEMYMKLPDVQPQQAPSPTDATKPTIPVATATKPSGKKP